MPILRSVETPDRLTEPTYDPAGEPPAALRRAGVEASAVQYLGVTHDTAIFTRVLPAAQRWHTDVVAALARLHRA